MFAFELRCLAHESEHISAELWDWEPLAVGERSNGDLTILVAGFANDKNRDELLRTFAPWQPEWRRDETDWVATTEAAWPPRYVGQRIVIVPPWDATPIPVEKIRVVLNPGMASGTGEHPCTQLAIEALERTVQSGSRIVDIGAGSGILAIVAAQLGAASVLAIEPDPQAVLAAHGNIGLNEKRPMLAAALSDAVATGWATVTIANISGSVLFAIFDELLRVTSAGSPLILSGFEIDEASRFQQLMSDAKLTTLDNWACLTAYVG